MILINFILNATHTYYGPYFVLTVFLYHERSWGLAVKLESVVIRTICKIRKNMSNKKLFVSGFPADPTYFETVWNLNNKQDI
jgi:hypothetical protein